MEILARMRNIVHIMRQWCWIIASGNITRRNSTAEEEIGRNSFMLRGEFRNSTNETHTTAISTGKHDLVGSISLRVLVTIEVIKSGTRYHSCDWRRGVREHKHDEETDRCPKATVGLDLQPQIWHFPELCLGRIFDVGNWTWQRKEESTSQSRIFTLHEKTLEDINTTISATLHTKINLQLPYFSIIYYLIYILQVQV